MAKIDPIKHWLGPVGQKAQYPTGVIYEVAKKIVHKGQLLPNGKVADADTQIYDGQYSVTAAAPDNLNGAFQPWQSSPVIVSSGEIVSITAQGQWSVIGQNLNGPGGYAGIVAHGPNPNAYPHGSGFLKADGKAIEGCLLVQDGSGSIQAFQSDGYTIHVSAPGRVLFAANDETIPLDGHLGFADNSGALIVTINFFAAELTYLKKDPL